LDKIVTYCKTVEKYIPSFSDFVVACEEYTPKIQKLVEVFNLQKVIRGLEDERLGKIMGIRSLKRRTNKLKQDVEAIKQRISKLQEEEYNRWYALFGNEQYYSTNQ
jgi:hypothetical protein